MAILDLDFELELPAFTVAVDLSVDAGTLALVGPSGAGKTTVLRAIAGLVDPDRGRIELDGRAWFDSGRRASLAPEERAVGLVFQDYALFPHLSVRANVAFGAGRDRDAVEELLERFRVSHLASAKPRTLSGGERQRVALARALARRPDVLLLDEPLSALDAHTRGVVRAELRELLDELALPTIMITHDFRDAAALATTAAAIVDGKLHQVGGVESLSRHPADAFVAALTGNNLLDAVAEPLNGGSRLLFDDGQALLAASPARGRVGVVVAPWDLRLFAAGESEPPPNSLRHPLGAVTRLGNRIEARVGPLAIECPAEAAEGLPLREGEPVWVQIPAEAITLVGRP